MTKTPTIAVIKKQLSVAEPPELIELCLTLAKFKKENKELLSYLLFDKADLNQYTDDIKAQNAIAFSEINYSNYYFMKKGIRKILKNVNKYIKFTKNKEVEIELLMDFCLHLKRIKPSIFKNSALTNLYDRQVKLILKAVDTLHEDLQYDYLLKIKQL
jgi:hypothetical protein